MTITSSGPISLLDLQNEFGGTNPISLSEYYAGGGLVPSGTSGINGAIPSSGPISLWNFYGASAALDTQTLTAGVFDYKGNTSYGYLKDAMGVMNDGTSNVYAGAVIGALYNFTNVSEVYLDILGSMANSGWTAMIIDGYTYSRASGTYTNNGSDTQWKWTRQANHFSVNGGNTVITWI